MIDPVTLLLARAAIACYAPGAKPSFETPTCQVFRSIADGISVFMIPGSETWDEWFEDFNPLVEPDPSEPDIGWVHEPSLNNARAIAGYILSATYGHSFYVAGYSKGAREAPIVHALLKHAGCTSFATRCFEPPRPGGSKLADYLATENIVGTQTSNQSGDDIVTLIPAGFGWEPACRNIKLQVPDSFGILQKHAMAGVMVGLGVTP